MKRTKVSREERAIEQALIKGEYVDISRAEFNEIVEAIARRRKDAVPNIRINSQDLKALKDKARRHGIKYQTFISELLHRAAHS
jgi:predicted DNA binding CopG/RHH family protein